MKTQYIARGTAVHYADAVEDFGIRATCATPEAAAAAAEMLNKARVLNDEKRRYTDAARMIARAESVDGFVWTE